MKKWATFDFNWAFVNCSASLKWLGPGTYTEKCCLPDGHHVVTCRTSRNKQDWSNNVLLISGHRFCEDFVGYEAAINIDVSGTSYNVCQYVMAKNHNMYYMENLILLK